MEEASRMFLKESVTNEMIVKESYSNHQLNMSNWLGG